MKNFSSLVRVSELVNIIILYSPTTNDDGKCARWCYWVALASNMRVTCGCEGLKSLDVKRFEILLSLASITIIRSSLKDAMKWKQMEVSRRRRIFCCVNGNDESLSLSFYLSLPNSLSLELNRFAMAHVRRVLIAPTRSICSSRSCEMSVLFAVHESGNKRQPTRVLHKGEVLRKRGEEMLN